MFRPLFTNLRNAIRSGFSGLSGFNPTNSTIEVVDVSDQALHVKVISGGNSFGQLSLKAQTSLVGDNTSKSLPTQTGATYALIQVKGSILSFRVDSATAVVNGNSEQTLPIDARIELVTALEISTFRCIQASPGVLSIIYRGA